MIGGSEKMASDSLFEKMVRVENKDIFLDLKENDGGIYLKISERRLGNKNTVLIPASGISKIRAILDEISKIESSHLLRVKDVKRPVVDDAFFVSVYVSGLAWEANETELNEMFKHCGTIVSSKILRRPNNRSLGCGIVQFETHEMAETAVNSVNNTQQDGRIIRVREDRIAKDNHGTSEKENVTSNNFVEKKSFPPNASEDKVIPQKVFVGNLSFDATKEEISAYFAIVGFVSSVEILTSKAGRPKGSAIVEFSKESEATNAILHLNGKEFKERNISVRKCFSI